MKKFYSVFKYIRLLIIIFGIPFILIELIRPGLLDFSGLWGDTYIFGAHIELIVQVIVVGSEVTERILKLKEARFYLFSPWIVLAFRRLKF